MIRPRRVLTAGLLTTLLTALLVAGCDGGGDEPNEEDANGVDTREMLLIDDDVPGATTAKDVDELVPATFCSLIGRAESRLRSYADGDLSVREIQVDTPNGEATVESAVFNVKRSALRSILLTNGVEVGIRSCSSRPMERGDQTETMAALTGLPDGCVGFSSTFTGKATEHTARAYAMVGSVVVVVGVRTSGAEPPDVPIADLVSTAVAKAQSVVNSERA